MKRAAFVCLVAFVTCSGLPIGDAHAIPPIELRSYRFIPQLSTLHQTGGIAGEDALMPITGGLDLATGFNSEFPPPQLVPFAQFLNVDAVAHHPIHDFPLPIDDLLNLSGLEGTFDPDQPNVLLFEGVDGQGAPMHARAVRFGRIVHLTGANRPQSNTADFFEYELDAIVIQTPFADFNSDGNVDGDDFLIWQENFAKHHPAILGVPGDANGDSRVNGDDFLIWQREFESDLDGDPSAVAAVPEPASATVACLLLGAAVSVVCRRRSH